MTLNQEEKIEKIRMKYLEKEENFSKIEKLKKLDKKVKNPARGFAYSYGIIGCLVLGTGMTFAMKILGKSIPALMPVGICIGIVGIIMLLTTYAIYKNVLNKRKKKYAGQIIDLSDELINKVD